MEEVQVGTCLAGCSPPTSAKVRWVGGVSCSPHLPRGTMAAASSSTASAVTRSWRVMMRLARVTRSPGVRPSVAEARAGVGGMECVEGRREERRRHLASAPGRGTVTW